MNDKQKTKRRNEMMVLLNETAKRRSKMMVLLNSTAHNLTDDQKRGFDEIVNLRDANPELFGRLVQTPADESAIRDLVSDFINFLIGFVREREQRGDTVKILFPIGSPAFQASFWMTIGTFTENPNIPILAQYIVFSHTRRESIETPDGKKISVFKHEKFISANKL